MSFDALAPHYRWLELVTAGNLLQQCRARFLDQVGSVHHALVLGPGVGGVLPDLARLHPNCRITCLDSSGRMLSLARRRLIRAGFDPSRAVFIHADVLDWQPPVARFDLVISNFFLDCFRPDQLAVIIPKITSATIRNAGWLIADFQLPDGGWQRARAKCALRLMYAFFRVATRLPAARLTDPSDLLRASGFALEMREERHHQLLHTDLWRKMAASLRSPHE